MSFAREVILQAADHIERHPELYDFFKHDIPEDNEVGCLLGWIGRLAGMAPVEYEGVSNPLVAAARKVGFKDDLDFYKALRRAGSADMRCEYINGLRIVRGWAYDAMDAVKALRALAETETVA